MWTEKKQNKVYARSESREDDETRGRVDMMRTDSHGTHGRRDSHSRRERKGIIGASEILGIEPNGRERLPEKEDGEIYKRDRESESESEKCDTHNRKEKYNKEESVCDTE